jgi:hypothetical protein
MLTPFCIGDGARTDRANPPGLRRPSDSVPYVRGARAQNAVVPAWICLRCGVQYPNTAVPPPRCPICDDERESVHRDGQRWTTTAELLRTHATELRDEEPDLVGVGVAPSFGIGQRALLVRTPHGNVLWDCVPLLDDAARSTVDGMGGVSAICVSHPHFYGAIVELAEAFDARVFLPRADERWIPRRSSRIELFDEEVAPVPGVTVARVGGHFDGSAVLHWAAGADGRGALLTGDTIMVVEDRDWVSFMWSYPNLVPLDAATVDDVAGRVGRFRFARVYGGWWGHTVLDGGAEVVRRSADRYVDRVRGSRPGRSSTR